MKFIKNELNIFHISHIHSKYLTSLKECGLLNLELREAKEELQDLSNSYKALQERLHCIHVKTYYFVFVFQASLKQLFRSTICSQLSVHYQSFDNF